MAGQDRQSSGLHAGQPVKLTCSNSRLGNLAVQSGQESMIDADDAIAGLPYPQSSVIPSEFWMGMGSVS